jgi:CHAT domain-containing protein
LDREQHSNVQHKKHLEKRDESVDDLEQQVAAWLATPTYRDERRYLEGHSALLSPQADTFIEQRVAETRANRASLFARLHLLRNQLTASPDSVQLPSEIEATRKQYAEQRQRLTEQQLALRLLREVRERTLTRPFLLAVREGYVNYRGGFVLDLPDWLEQYRQEDGQHRQVRDSVTLARARAARGRATLKRARQTPALAPEILASLHHLLYEILDDIQGQDIASIQEEAMMHIEEALSVFTRERYPYQWAVLHKFLGNLCQERTSGDEVTNLEQALAQYRYALEVFTEEAFSVDWASVQNNLGVIYQGHLSDDPIAHQEQALAHFTNALKVYTEEDFPLEWAGIQSNLGVVYQERLQGEPLLNQEEALARHTSALRVFTEHHTPLDWAQTMTNLGNLYQIHIQGERANNQEEALACYTQALRVLTEEHFPLDWAIIQNNLGAVYRERIRGNKAANQRLSITAHHKALCVFTEQAYPAHWAKVQNNLGNVYQEHVGTDLAAYQEQAIRCYTAALRVFTEEGFPIDWAMIQHNLGTIYTSRIQGDMTTNLEQAIAYFTASLPVYTEETFPMDWALAQNNLGVLYWGRVREGKALNLEQAIACFANALRVYTQAISPTDWAMLQNNLGMVYVERVEGNRVENLEQAITCFTNALQVYTRLAFPQAWARTQNNLGLAYLERLAEKRTENLKQAKAHLRQALSIYKEAAFPYEWAIGQRNLGNTYAARQRGRRNSNQMRQAIDCFTKALRVFTKEHYPSEHRLTSLYLAEVYADQGMWQEAHITYTSARQAEEMLLTLSGGTREQDAVLQEGRDAAVREAFALAHLGQIDAAVLAVERGRARFLEAMRQVDSASPEQIRDPGRRERYELARKQLRTTQTALHGPLLPSLSELARQQMDLARLKAFQQARTNFEAVIEEIRTNGDPADFLSDTLDIATIYQASTYCGAEHALIYLLATPWGGLALVARAGNGLQGMVGRCRALELPQLTTDFLESLVEVKLPASGYIIGGLAHAQENSGWNAIEVQEWTGETFAQKARALHEACTGVSSVLALAAEIVAQSPALTSLTTQPLSQLDEQERETLATTVNTTFLRLEVSRCLKQLAPAFQPLIEWLYQEGISHVTLIPCGLLAAFPLLALPIAITDASSLEKRADETSDKPSYEAWGDCFVTSMAPSARSLHSSTQPAQERAGVYALGNPWHGTHVPSRSDLHWGEAEALHLAALGGNRRQAAIQRKATRKWFLQHVRLAAVFDAACHGDFNRSDYLASSLRMADGRITLAEVFNQIADLRELRLLILSACQTAIIDLRGARDEVRSLAAGMLQAGARAVIAAHWPVDDRATYLLMVRFAQEWFPNRAWEPPAEALARAQRWLRSLTYRDLATWEAAHPLPARPPFTRNIGLATVRSVGQRIDDPYIESLLAMLQTTSTTRHPLEEARAILHATTRQHTDNFQGDEHPYADPYFWAGFHVSGW